MSQNSMTYQTYLCLIFYSGVFNKSEERNLYLNTILRRKSNERPGARPSLLRGSEPTNSHSSPAPQIVQQQALVYFEIIQIPRKVRDGMSRDNSWDECCRVHGSYTIWPRDEKKIFREYVEYPWEIIYFHAAVTGGKTGGSKSLMLITKCLSSTVYAGLVHEMKPNTNDIRAKTKQRYRYFKTKP